MLDALSSPASAPHIAPPSAGARGCSPGAGFFYLYGNMHSTSITNQILAGNILYTFCPNKSRIKQHLFYASASIVNITTPASNTNIPQMRQPIEDRTTPIIALALLPSLFKAIIPIIRPAMNASKLSIPI